MNEKIPEKNNVYDLSAYREERERKKGIEQIDADFPGYTQFSEELTTAVQIFDEISRGETSPSFGDGFQRIGYEELEGLITVARMLDNEHEQNVTIPLVREQCMVVIAIIDNHRAAFDQITDEEIQKLRDFVSESDQ